MYPGVPLRFIPRRAIQSRLQQTGRLRRRDRAVRATTYAQGAEPIHRCTPVAELVPRHLARAVADGCAAARAGRSS